MAKVEVPFTEQEVDTSSPTSAAMTIVLLIGGFAVFSMASGIGDYVASRANNSLAAVIGFNPATGSDGDSTPDVV